MSSNGWQMVPLEELLSRNEKTVSLLPDQRYQEVTIRLWGKGVVLRGVVNGAGIAADRRFEVSTGQFIVSRIDARNGAMGIVPPELDNAIVTNDFPSFNVNRDRIIPEFLGWLCRTAGFVDQCRTGSEGTTNRVRLKEDRFLGLTIPLPPLEEQRRIVARIDRLAAMINEADQLNRRLSADRRAFTASLHFSRSKDRKVKMSQLVELAEEKGHIRLKRTGNGLREG
jgi:type I restriction enzyme S subunit